MWQPLWLDKKKFKQRSHTQKSHPKMVNPRDLAGNAEEEEKEEGDMGIALCSP